MEILLLTSEKLLEKVLPSLSLLSHTVQIAPVDVNSLLEMPASQLIIIDARYDLMSARGFTRLVSSTDTSRLLAVVLTEGNLVALHSDWGIDDFFLPTVGPAELETRLRLLCAKSNIMIPSSTNDKVVIGDLIVDEDTYTARLKGEPLDLTYKEFELLKHFVNNVGRVFTRAQLLQEVWGYDFFGGSRTVDVHVRRLRAKLGNDYESLIGTVRNVGYKAVKPFKGETQCDDKEAELSEDLIFGTDELISQESD